MNPQNTEWDEILDFAIMDTPYGIFVYDLSVLTEGVPQMGWSEK